MSSSQAADQARSMAESILDTPKSSSQPAQPVPLIASLNALTISDDVKPKSKPVLSHDLFIGDLARSVTSEQLRDLFSRHGEVVTVDIKKDKYTLNNLGYGFVAMRTRHQAETAKTALNGAELGNRRVRINWAQKNTTLFVGDLDGTVNTADLRHIFKAFGDIIEEETFVKAGSGKFGFVRFKHRSDAERAKAYMNKRKIGSRVVRVGWGDNNIQKHCVHMQFQQYEDSKELTEENVKAFFSRFGQIVNATLPRDHNGKYKGYGFVHFEDNESGEKSAGNVIASMPQSVVCGVPVRLSYRKRQARTRGKRTATHGQTLRFRPKYMDAPMAQSGQHTWGNAPNYYSSYGMFVPQVTPYYDNSSYGGSRERYVQPVYAHQGYVNSHSHSGAIGSSPLFVPQHSSPRNNQYYGTQQFRPTNPPHSPLYTSHTHNNSPPYGPINTTVTRNPSVQVHSVQIHPVHPISPVVLSNMPRCIPPLSLYSSSPRILTQIEHRVYSPHNAHHFSYGNYFHSPGSSRSTTPPSPGNRPHSPNRNYSSESDSISPPQPHRRTSHRPTKQEVKLRVDVHSPSLTTPANTASSPSTNPTNRRPLVINNTPDKKVATKSRKALAINRAIQPS